MPVNTTSMLNSLLHWKLSLFSSVLFSDNSYLEKKWLNPEFAKWTNFVQIKERVPKVECVSYVADMWQTQWANEKQEKKKSALLNLDLGRSARLFT